MKFKYNKYLRLLLFKGKDRFLIILQGRAAKNMLELHLKSVVPMD